MNRRFLILLAIGACALVGRAEEEPAGETLGSFCWSTRTGAVVTVDVAADAVRVLDAMPYGRGTGTKIIKTGAGKLVVKDLRNYPGTFQLREGSVRIGDVDEAAGESEVNDIQTVEISDGTTIEVADGKTARIAVKDPLRWFTKAGGGTLEVVNTTQQKLIHVTIAGGQIVYVNEPTVSSLAQLAAGPSMHLDANDADSFEFSSDKYVSKWYDAKGINYAETAAGSPVLVEGATTNTLGGVQTPLNAVSFGGFRSQSRASFHEATHGVRVAFVVAAKGGSNQIGMLLGNAQAWCLGSTMSNSDIVDFKYGHDSIGWPSYPFYAYLDIYNTVRHGSCGTTYYYWDGTTNGVRRTGSTTQYPQQAPAPISTTDFTLYEIALPVGAHVSALAGFGNDYLFSGGWRYGEVILYERPLTDRERIATRNYLARKWLSRTDEELTPLPDAPADPDPFVIPDYDVGDGETIAVASGDTFGITRLAGQGTFTKAGGGTLAVQDFVGYTGTVMVTEGVLKLTGARPDYEPVDPAELGPTVHFDASAEGSFTYINKETGTFSAWASKNGAGVSAKKKLNSISASGTLNVQTDSVLGGRRYVNFPTYTGATFRDDATGGTNTLNVKTMVQVVGSQNGGGMLLGGRDSGSYCDPFFRGPGKNGSYGGYADDPILWGGADTTYPAKRGEFYLNFERLVCWLSDYTRNGARDPTEVGLSGGWDIVGFRASSRTETDRQVVSQGLAYESVPTHCRDGKQNLAEIAIWTNRILGADEVLSAEAFLKIKYYKEPTWQRSRVNGLTVDLAAGTALDLGGTNQYFEAVTGAGTLQNGTVSLGTIALDVAREATALAVALDLGSTKTISIDNVLLAEVNVKTPLLTATSISGTLDGIAITGLEGLPSTLRPSLTVEGGSLVLCLEQISYLRVLEPEEGERVPVAGACTTAVGYVVGEGTFVKTGAGILYAKDVVGYTGTVTVAEGTFCLSGYLPPVEPSLPNANNLVLHLDAADESTLTTKTVSGVEYVEEWRSKTSNGWTAKPRDPSQYNKSHAWLEADSDLDGQKTVRFWHTSGAGMYFYDANGNRACSSNVLSALWMLGSQEGGGFLFGQKTPFGNKGESTAKTDGWHRGESGWGGKYTDYVFYIGAYNGLRTSEMYFNDRRMCGSDSWPKGKTTPDLQSGSGFSGKWDAITLRVNSPTYANTIAADGLAFHTIDSYARNGSQRLVETLIYERQLTEDEAYRANVYLRAKWGTENWQRSQTNGFEVGVSAGATLDLGGTNQYLRAVGGAGTVANGNLTASGLIASSEGALAVSGTFTATDGFTVDLSALPVGLRGEFTILSAGALVNSEAIQTATIVPGHYSEARLIVRENTVSVRLQRRGIVIIFR